MDQKRLRSRRINSTYNAILVQPVKIYKFINNDEGVGCFNIMGHSPVSNELGNIILAQVPDDGHDLFVDVNHLASYRLQIINQGDRCFHLIQKGLKPNLLMENEGLELRSESFGICWDTNVRSDIDVRVTICIIPLAEEHGILLSYSAVPFSEALEADRVAKLKAINPLKRFFSFTKES